MISINLIDKCGTKSVKLSSNKKVVTKNDDKCHTNSSDGRAKYELGALVGALSPQAGILHTKCFSFSGTYNHFHNILRLFDVLPSFSFSKSETMQNYYLLTWYIRVASQVAEQLKELGS